MLCYAKFLSQESVYSRMETIFFPVFPVHDEDGKF